jgi:hypothetical protein
MKNKWIYWHLKKGSVGVVGEKSLQKKKPSHGKMKPSTALGRRNGGSLAGYSGRIALRREQYDT